MIFEGELVSKIPIMKIPIETSFIKHGIAMFTLIFSFVACAQDYYWVGGTGNWSDYENHWATSSGGTEFHTSAPGASNNVIFDENSFTEEGQVVLMDLEEVFVRDMDWSVALYEPTFSDDHSKNFQSLNLGGSMYLVEHMTFDWNSEGRYLDFAPQGGISEIDSKGVGFGETQVIFNTINGGISVLDSLTMYGLGFINVRNPIDFNTNAIHTTDILSNSLTYFSQIDLSNCSIYTKSLDLGGSAGTSAEFLIDGAAVTILYPYGTTQINKDRYPNPFENYVITADHSIVNQDPIFNKLILKPDVELIIHDLIEGIEFNELTAEGTVDERITIKSSDEGSSAHLIQSSGPVNFYFVDFKDIEATGGATFNAYGSRDLGNVTGINFFKADQEISFGPIDDQWIGDGDLLLSATSDSNLPVSYSDVFGPVELIGSNISFTDIGVVRIIASQAGDEMFNAADDVLVEFEIFKRGQTISFKELNDVSEDEGFINLDATSDSELPITYSVVGPVKEVDGVLEFTGSGNVQVTAKQEGNNLYLAAEPVRRSFEILETPLSLSDADSLDVIYPNPAKDFLHFDPKLKIKSVQVTNLSGKIYEGVEIAENSIKVSGWESGIYILSILTEEGEEITKRIVKY